MHLLDFIETAIPGPRGPLAAHKSRGLSAVLATWGWGHLRGGPSAILACHRHPRYRPAGCRFVEICRLVPPAFPRWDGGGLCFADLPPPLRLLAQSSLQHWAPALRGACQHHARSARFGVSTTRCQHGLVSAPRGVSTIWCQHHAVSARTGANFKLVPAPLGFSANWCQHELVSAPLGVSTNWCQHHAVSARIGVSTNWRQHRMVSAPLGVSISWPHV
jgi:hypothetical protein